MNYSGPASLADVEADLLLSDEDDIADRHWPPLESHTQHAGPSPWHQPAPRASTSKRSMDQTSDTSDSPSPAPKILHQLVTAQELSLCIRYLWIPSHVGIVNNDKVDLLAKAACELPLPDDATPSLFRYKGIIHSASLLPTLNRMNAERAHSVSIQHYDNFRLSQPRYRRHGLMEALYDKRNSI
ncbi:hypothetical protein Pmani_002547 [Petrolisthes manimaculis]|uniref:RNase H type-1 domain-containing protein n=1 Tax=Petrolisthes manimaculis TaxID=1843537 RepID=A0AAE1UJ94_9EUCA|nr:hypothetical protein Pmani_002547 [Petrolisthes manimaculis]